MEFVDLQLIMINVDNEYRHLHPQVSDGRLLGTDSVGNMASYLSALHPKQAGNQLTITFLAPTQHNRHFSHKHGFRQPRRVHRHHCLLLSSPSPRPPDIPSHRQSQPEQRSTSQSAHLNNLRPHFLCSTVAQPRENNACLRPCRGS